MQRTIDTLLTLALVAILALLVARPAHADPFSDYAAQRASVPQFQRDASDQVSREAQPRLLRCILQARPLGLPAMRRLALETCAPQYGRELGYSERLLGNPWPPEAQRQAERLAWDIAGVNIPGWHVVDGIQEGKQP
jgi:hypothetical protein